MRNAWWRIHLNTAYIDVQNVKNATLWDEERLRSGEEYVSEYFHFFSYHPLLKILRNMWCLSPSRFKWMLHEDELICRCWGGINPFKHLRIAELWMLSSLFYLTHSFIRSYCEMSEFFFSLSSTSFLFIWIFCCFRDNIIYIKGKKERFRFIIII